jgi:hypothetical protein
MTFSISANGSSHSIDVDGDTPVGSENSIHCARATAGAQSRTVSAETASLSPAKGLGAAQAILATLAFSSSIKTRLFSE